MAPYWLRIRDFCSVGLGVARLDQPVYAVSRNLRREHARLYVANEDRFLAHVAARIENNEVEKLISYIILVPAEAPVVLDLDIEVPIVQGYEKATRACIDVVMRGIASSVGDELCVVCAREDDHSSAFKIGLHVFVRIFSTPSARVALGEAAQAIVQSMLDAKFPGGTARADHVTSIWGSHCAHKDQATGYRVAAIAVRRKMIIVDEFPGVAARMVGTSTDEVARLVCLRVERKATSPLMTSKEEDTAMAPEPIGQTRLPLWAVHACAVDGLHTFTPEAFSHRMGDKGPLFKVRNPHLPRTCPVCTADHTRYVWLLLDEGQTMNLLCYRCRDKGNAICMASICKPSDAQSSFAPADPLEQPDPPADPPAEQQP